MDWVVATLYGMAGGLIVEAVSIWGHLSVWQAARHTARRRGRVVPKLTRYIDPAADALVATTRLALGALAGFALHSQLSTVITAIAVGASAPALLSQLGTVRRVEPATEEKAS